MISASTVVSNSRAVHKSDHQGETLPEEVHMYGAAESTGNPGLPFIVLGHS